MPITTMKKSTIRSLLNEVKDQESLDGWLEGMNPPVMGISFDGTQIEFRNHAGDLDRHYRDRIFVRHSDFANQAEKEYGERKAIVILGQD